MLSRAIMRPKTSGNGFDPRCVAGITLWLDAADPATLGPTSSGPGSVTNNGPVKYWGDKSGSGKNVTNSGADSVCPTFVASYYQGRPGILFDGGDVLSTTAAGLQIAPATIFAAIDEVTRVRYGGIVVAAPGSGNDFDQNGAAILTVHDNPDNVEPVLYASLAASAAGTALQASQGTYLSSLGKRVISASATSSTAFLRVNGTQGTTDTSHTASGTSAGIVVGGRYLSGAISSQYRFNGRILEVLHYNRALSSSEITVVERYLAGKWGMTLA